MSQKIKNDAESAELKNQLQYTPQEDKLSIPARIYRAKDHTGILVAVEDRKGDCFVGYFSTVTRGMRRADLRSVESGSKETISGMNPKCRNWSDAQKRLDVYAAKNNLVELPLSIGGEI